MDSISHMPSPKSLSNSFHCWLNLFISVPRRFAVLARCYPIKLFQVMQILFIHPEHFRSCFLSRSSGGHFFGRFLRSKFSDSFSNYSISVPFYSSQYYSGPSFKYSSISSQSLRSFASKSPSSIFVF